MADVAGYSRLVERDERATVERLRGHRKELVEPLLAEHRGRIVKLTGDGAICEFGSAVDAVECAVRIQRGMAEREAGVPEAECIRFRIGVNLGDVIHDEGDLYGDGVNIAARLEGIADPGGICVSRTVHDYVRGKVPVAFQALGPRRVKNISEPVEAYRVDLRGASPASSRPGAPRRVIAATVIGLLLVLVVGSAWLLRERPAGDAGGEPSSGRPSVAVLPFANLSGDPGQDYFADGLTEDITTALSRFPGLLVIARNSTFRYKGQASDVGQVGRELGVRYVLEGSVRREGTRVRVTAQLIDTRNGTHRWADRYDRDLTGIFAVQDEITQRIIGALVAQVSRDEAARSSQKPPESWEAYDYLLQALAKDQLRRASRRGELLAEVRRLLERSTAIDPTYARAWAALAENHLNAWLEPYDHPLSREEYQQPSTLDRALVSAQKAVELDGGSPEAHAALGIVLHWKHRQADAVAEFQRALELNPNLAAPRYGDVLVYAGRTSEAIDAIKRSMRLDPFFTPVVLGYLGHAYYAARQYGPAIEQLTACTRLAPKFRPCRIWLAAAYARSGRPQEARAEASQALQLQPDLTIGKWMRFAPYADPADAEHLADGLRKAGLPE